MSNNENIIEEETYWFEPEDAKIKMSFDKYSLDKMDVYLSYHYEVETEEDIDKYNEYVDKFNNTYGDTQNSNSISKLKYDSLIYYYYININKDLSKECDDPNCALCLRNETDYCLVCNYQYNILYGESYYNGKKKICKNMPNTDESSYNEEQTNPQSSNIDTSIKMEQMTYNSDISTTQKNPNVDISTNPEVNTDTSDILTTEKTSNIINEEKLTNNFDITTIQKTSNFDFSSIPEIINTESKKIELTFDNLIKGEFKNVKQTILAFSFTKQKKKTN